MKIVIDDFDFFNMEAEKYWSAPKKVSLKELAVNAIDSGDYMGARKVDGHWYMCIKDNDGNCYLRSRDAGVSGEYANKIDWVPHLKESLQKLPNGTVVIGEIYFDGNEGSKKVTTIMGCLQEKAVARQNKGDKLSYWMFDCICYGGKSTMNLAYIYRVDLLNACERTCDSTYIHAAKFYDREDLKQMLAYWQEEGYEGTVLQRKDGKYEPGKRPARKSIKVKKELSSTIDAFLTGNYKTATWEYKGKEIETWQYWFHTKTNMKLKGDFYEAYHAGEYIQPISKGAFYEWASSIEVGVMKNGEVYPIGWISNITEEVQKGIVEEPEKWTHKVVSLTAMMLDDESFKLRHGKIVEWRADGDKDWKECDWEQLLSK